MHRSRSETKLVLPHHDLLGTLSYFIMYSSLAQHSIRHEHLKKKVLLMVPTNMWN